MNVKPTGYLYTESTMKSLESILSILAEDKTLIEEVREKGYSVSDTIKIQNPKLSYRIINSWDSAGLLVDDRSENSREWRKFSMIDLAFIAIINQLRDFGLSVDKIREVKSYLYRPVGVLSGIHKNEQPEILKEVTFLEWAYFRSFHPLVGDNTYLLVESDGCSMLLGGRDVSLNITKKTLSPKYITLNLNHIFAGLIDENVGIDWSEKQPIMNEAEETILTVIRDNNADNIVIEKDKEGKLDRVKHSLKVRFADYGGMHNLINKFGYGKIADANFKDGSLVGSATVEKHTKLKK